MVEEADQALLTGTSVGPGTHGSEVVDLINLPPVEAATTSVEPSPPKLPARSPIASLTRDYRDALTEVRWEVVAFEVAADDPVFDGRQTAWRLRQLTTGVAEFLVNASHDVFASATLTPMDALLAELAFQALDRQRGNPNAPAFAQVLSGLRASYASRSSLDPVVLSAEAADTVTSVARSLRSTLSSEENRSLFDELTPTEQAAVHQRMASRAVKQPQAAIDEGRFLEYSPRRVLVTTIERHPELFFDGHYWNEEYEALNYQNPAITEEARRRTLEHFLGLLEDAIWLEELEPTDAALYGRERLLRAALALELLANATSVAGQA